MEEACIAEVTDGDVLQNCVLGSATRRTEGERLRWLARRGVLQDIRSREPGIDASLSVKRAKDANECGDSLLVEGCYNMYDLHELTETTLAYEHSMKKAAVAVLIAALAAPCPALARRLVDCFYSPRPTAHQPSPEPGRHPKCLAVADNGSVRVLPRHLKALDYSDDGLSVLWVEGGMLYVKPSGETLDVLPQDNGADTFQEGLVRGRRNGKIAFFDHSFRMVLPPKYDFAWPFEDGLAEVCSGCVQAPPDPADPEHHTSMEGGSWGFIDRQGREVVPVSYPRDEAWRRKGDAAKQ